ncbi:hypothetical protein H4Q26_013720 [Puccinia striiformis f. sp. tritici PST-130]|nr:hypothetical protein H4Q26_013720 [Puccinia striiformis f. sp. tritici PST-130]
MVFVHSTSASFHSQEILPTVFHQPRCNQTPNHPSTHLLVAPLSNLLHSPPKHIESSPFQASSRGAEAIDLLDRKALKHIELTGESLRVDAIRAAEAERRELILNLTQPERVFRDKSATGVVNFPIYVTSAMVKHPITAKLIEVGPYKAPYHRQFKHLHLWPALTEDPLFVSKLNQSHGVYGKRSPNTSTPLPLSSADGSVSIATSKSLVHCLPREPRRLDQNNPQESPTCRPSGSQEGVETTEPYGSMPIYGSPEMQKAASKYRVPAQDEDHQVVERFIKTNGVYLEESDENVEEKEEEPIKLDNSTLKKTALLDRIPYTLSFRNPMRSSSVGSTQSSSSSNSNNMSSSNPRLPSHPSLPTVLSDQPSFSDSQTLPHHFDTVIPSPTNYLFPSRLDYHYQ